jgi:regulator of replication initiation timing
MSDPKWIEDARKSFALSKSGLREYSPAEGGRLEKKGKELEAENAVLQEENKKLREALEEVKELTGGEYDYYVYNVAEKALNETK